MFNLCSRITITSAKESVQYSLDFLESVEISSSWQSIADSATVKLPKNIYVRENNSIISWAKRNIASKDLWKMSENSDKPLFNRGDIIKIELGYDLIFDTVFFGFIDSIGSDVPIELKCYDVSWLFNNVQLAIEDFPKSNITLKSIADMLEKKFRGSADYKNFTDSKKSPELENIKFEINTSSELPLTDFKIESQSMAKVIERLKAYEVEVYTVLNETADGVTLDVVFGKAYGDTSDNSTPLPVFNFQKNVIASNLVNKEEAKIKEQVLAVSIPTQGTEVIEAKLGDIVNGEKTVLTFFDLTSEQLNDIAIRKLEKTRYDGYEGSFQTFGQPLIRQGNRVQLEDTMNAEHTGTFRVRGVDYSFGAGGYRQNISLHMRIAK